MKTNDVSLSERNYVLAALQSGLRLDGRALDAVRTPAVRFADENGAVDVDWGATKLAVKVSAEIVAPYADRPNEGVFQINNEVSSMAAAKFDNDRSSSDEVIVNRILEKTIQRSNALDLESLCIVNGKKVWLVKVDLNMLNFDGNLVDAACFAIMLALLSFKLPSYELDNHDVKLYNLAEKPAVSLSILHIPVCVSVVFVNPLTVEENLKGDANSEIAIFDPTDVEESVSQSLLVVSLNSNKELIQMAKIGGVPIDSLQLVDITSRCYATAVERTQLIKKLVQENDDMVYKKQNLGLLEVGADISVQ